MQQANEPLHYALTVESYYKTLRGRLVAFTAADWIAVESWHRLGIPIHCALKGMDRAFSRQQADIRSLRSCDSSVREVCRETCSVLTTLT